MLKSHKSAFVVAGVLALITIGLFYYGGEHIFDGPTINTGSWDSDSFRPTGLSPALVSLIIGFATGVTGLIYLGTGIVKLAKKKASK